MNLKNEKIKYKALDEKEQYVFIYLKDILLAMKNMELGDNFECYEMYSNRKAIKVSRVYGGWIWRELDESARSSIFIPYSKEAVLA